ncbi:Peptidase C48, SUMO/Sentrin/Ubl1 [Corchorus capsularis]|uniref:Peptidase C48, SUMO/Sentrin/Ubl1 n=1 Tax=Corchorus capsularis TaxID=210143 RepID=A0A1R3FYR1_COCAP|nr:Peptidase C48, SUMO/Sentrin/Ubl1 [Corchorus capsularis]
MAVERPRKGFARLERNFVRFYKKKKKKWQRRTEWWCLRKRVAELEGRLDGVVGALEGRLDGVEGALKDLIRAFEKSTLQRNSRDETKNNTEDRITVVLSNSIPVTPTCHPLLFDDNSRSGYANNSNPWLGGVAKVCSEINAEYESKLDSKNESGKDTNDSRVNLVGKEIDKAKEFLVGKEQGKEVNESGESSTSSEGSISRSEIEAFQALRAYPNMPTDDGAESSFGNPFDYSQVFKPSPEKWIEYKTHARYKRARDAINDDGQKLKEIKAGLKECVRSYRRSIGPLESDNHVTSEQSASISNRESDRRTVSSFGLHESGKLKSGNGNGKATCSRKRAASGSTTTSRRRRQKRNDADIENIVQEFLQMKPIPSVKGKRKLVDFGEIFCSWEDFASLSMGGWLQDTVIDTVAKMCREESRAEEPSMRRLYLPTPYSTWILCRTATIRSMISHFRTSNKVMTSLDNCEQIFIPINNNLGHWYLIVLDFTKREVLIFDSKEPLTAELYEMRLSQIRQVLKFTQELLTHPSYEVGGREFGNISQWRLTVPPSVPQQENCDDCGMFVATFMLQMHLYSYELVLNKERTIAIEFMKEELKRARLRC